MKRALIVDDDEITRFTITDMLEMIDFNVEFAENGKEGVRKIKMKDYDIVLLDIRMPSVNGEQVMTILDRIKKDLPIIIISGHLTKDQLFRLKKKGAKGFLAKPFDTKTLFCTIEKVCKMDVF